VNIAKVAKLQAEGRMTPAGMAAFAQRTQTKSKVYAYEQEAPTDFTAAEQREFRRHPQAWRHFEESPPSYRKVVMHWVGSAKKPETRAKRFRALLEACMAGKRLR
jgi:uncharacterized protein YdeI (YjbR/CyaY-like superfamily)